MGGVPQWSKNPRMGYKLVNAQSETATTMPSFLDGIRHRRCLVTADGWYAWRTTLAGKMPMFMQYVGNSGKIEPFFFAGLWDSWRSKDQPAPHKNSDAVCIETFTILTRAACPNLRFVHDRMPVILPSTAYDAWLDCTITNENTATEILSTAIVATFRCHPVSVMVTTQRTIPQRA